ncbi:MAG: hypothetical protein HOP25_00395 [Methylotenera sp.]|nr:hypothetical protein [Methylotenera sp.]
MKSKFEKREDKEFYGKYSYLQEILNSIDNFQENKLFSDRWIFKRNVIDFKCIDILKVEFPEWAQNIGYDITILAKILFLESMDSGTSFSIVKGRFDSIVKSLFYFAKNNKSQLMQSDLESYFSFILMHSLVDNCLKQRLTPMNFTAFRCGLNLKKWNLILKLYKIPLLTFPSNLSDKLITKSLKSSLSSISADEITYNDWLEGGSLNFLTLDYGKYYVEHCAEFFDKHINLAIALKNTHKQSAEIVSKAGYAIGKGRLKGFFQPVIGHFLTGKGIKDLSPNLINKLQIEHWEKIQKITLETLTFNLRPYRVMEELLKKESLIEIARDVGILSLDDNTREWLAYLITIYCDILNSTNSKEFISLRQSELDFAMKTRNDNFDVMKLEEKFLDKHQKLTIELQINLPDTDYFKNAGILESASYKYITRFLRFVEAAGVVKFVAFTGWRESEYGFSLNDLKVEPNYDILDQFFCPVRYTVNWFVPKTNSKTKLNREITQLSYLCALNLKKLTNLKEFDSPCIYAPIVKTTTPQNSGEYIQRRIDELWIHFVNEYKPFKNIKLFTEYKNLQTQITLNNEDNLRLAFLSSQPNLFEWETQTNNLLLFEAYKRSQSELGRVTFFLDQKARKGFIWSYKTGKLSVQMTEFLEKYLSNETLSLIKQLQTKFEVTAHITRFVTNELLQDCLYPTPHAFRHMWAEAVYRRFDGDVGWIIRSNFKHISLKMWLAYIRNKDNRRQHDQVKRKVVSSILNNYMLKKGKGYAGALDKLLRRLFLKTEITTIDKLNEAISQFGTLEIQDIKSNPWGYCILKRRNQTNAKCADQGVPQRHNANPNLCLGCTNNLNTYENVDGILLGISNDLKVLRNSHVPSSFRNVSLKTVKNAYKILRNLHADEITLLEIAECIKKSQKLDYA